MYFTGGTYRTYGLSGSLYFIVSCINLFWRTKMISYYNIVFKWFGLKVEGFLTI